jgi:hypothetical protein
MEEIIMNSKKKVIGSALAVAAAIAFSTMPVLSSAHGSGKRVHCYGVNSCKGKGSCKTSTSSCKGENSCKGKGVKMMTKKECLKKGGKVKSKKHHDDDDDNM